METSEYIYPFSPFQDLTRKKKQWKIVEERTVSWETIATLIHNTPVPQPKITGETPEEKILCILRDDDYRLGPLTFQPELQMAWLAKIRESTSRGVPLPLVVMACPFKVQVPLKTDRKLADMGEALFLRRLKVICDLIRAVYPPGATVSLLSEGGVFGKFIGVPKRLSTAYRESVELMVKRLGYTDCIKIHNLEEIEERVPRFSALWISHYVKLTELFESGDPEFLERFRAAYRSVVRMINTNDHPEKLLMDVYDFTIPPERLPIRARKVRQTLLLGAKDAVLWYTAFIRARDNVNYLDKLVPGHLKLTVSLKPEDPGIFAVNRRSMILPYHGVPVFHTKREDFSTEYLTNLKRSRRPYQVIYLENDLDPAPFYYETK